MLFAPVLLLSLAVGSLARSSFGRSPSRPSLEHRQLVRRCKPHSTGHPTPTGTPGSGPNNGPPTNSSAPSGSGGKFKQEVMYKGEDFFSQWDFFTEDDPTHGLVNYQSQGDAESKHLAFVDGDATILAVDATKTLQPGQKRDSVRITSKKKWSAGLFIADFSHMPFGCSTWPAYWSVGPGWPNAGEIDVVEGVNQQSTNQYTLHTSEGCKASKGSVDVSGKPGQTTQCATIGGDNTGCAYIDTDARSYGQGFNDAGGGVFAHLWDHTGIKIWHFARSDVPSNIQSGSPDPSGWGSPAAFWSSDTCDIGQHFHDHSLVIDTTLCGDWAGAVYSSAGCPGTCEQAVADPKNFKDAKWKINFVAVYQPA